jgi:mannose-6-phosphate isomerase-like protein (cupin superfamily)
VGDYTIARRDEALDFMASYPGYGEMRSYTGALGAEQVALTWRRMPAGTGGRGSYGHSHRTQEEIYLVVSGVVTAKIGEEVVKLEPGTALRISPSAVRSIHNDGPDDAELVICSLRVDDPMADAEQTPDFWPEAT